MGCGNSDYYTEEEIQVYMKKSQSRLPSAELINGQTIKLRTTDGFFNGNSLLDGSWLRGEMTPNEYRQSIEHINERVTQSMIGTSKTFPIDQISSIQSTKLAVEELNSKYKGKIHFTYQPKNAEENSQNANESFLLIDFK